VLFLILAFVNAAALFVLMGAEFLAMILIIVYVGAVAVLFLFVVMMLDVDFVELRQGFLNYLPVGILVGFVFLLELVFVGVSWVISPTAPKVLATPIASNVLFRSRRAGSAGRHDRRHRAYAAAQAERQATERRRAGRAHQGDFDRDPPGAAGAGDLT
jgi:hypothetical protein